MLEKSTISFIMKLEKRDGGCEMFDIMTMAENIKTYRNKRGLNQYEFAEKLGISPQAVSKWECGLSCPSVENLCVISEILDVSIDTLIGENSDSEKMMIGIDGGERKQSLFYFRKAEEF